MAIKEQERAGVVGDPDKLTKNALGMPPIIVFDAKEEESRKISLQGTEELKGVGLVIFTVGEVARKFNVHRNTVRQWEKRGLIQARRIGSRNDRRFLGLDVENFMRENVSFQPRGENEEKLKSGAESALLTVKQVAELLHVHPNTARNWINQGLIRSWRLGTNPCSHRRIPLSEVERFLRE